MENELENIGSKIYTIRGVKVMLDCDVNNLGSDRTLKALGGKLERTEVAPSDGVLTNVYWFDVEETINNYKTIYEPFLCINNSKIK